MKDSHQSWYVPTKPLSKIIGRVSGPLIGTTFITHRGRSISAVANLFYNRSIGKTKSRERKQKVKFSYPP